jgi:hypothetical protein
LKKRNYVKECSSWASGPSPKIAAIPQVSRLTTKASAYDVPRDTIDWTVINSTRLDIALSGNNRFRLPRTQHVLPASERRVMRWIVVPMVARATTARLFCSPIGWQGITG